MLFKMAWTHSPEARDRTIKQFMATGGMPSENEELVSRYHQSLIHISEPTRQAEIS